MKETGSNLLELVKSTPNQEIVKMVKSYIEHSNSEHTSLIENNHEVTTVGEVYSEE